MINEAQSMTEADQRLINEKVGEAMARLHVPGVAVGIINGAQEFVGGWGVTNVDHPLPIDADTLFQIGSTTKTFTALVVMQLVEAGQLELDAPVRHYLPDLRLSDDDVAARVTLRQLFMHIGGWLGDHFADHGWGDDALTQIVASLNTIPQITPLGEVWSYNNAGFYIAGRVIEVVTGKPYETVIKEQILDPLGMHHSYFFPADLMTYRFAVGHVVKDDVAKVTRPWALPRTANPAGGITSSVKDQLIYARFHMGDGTAADGTQLLSPEAMTLMQTPQFAAQTSLAEHVGIAWLMKTLDGVKLVGHGGTTNGQLSAFQMAPERQFAITVLTNADRGGTLHGEITKWAFEHFLGIAQPEAVPLEIEEAQLVPYLGHYTSPVADAELGLRDDGLVLTLTQKKQLLTTEERDPIPPMRVALYALDRFVVLDGQYKDTRGEFLRGSDDGIAWLRTGGRVYKHEG